MTERQVQFCSSSAFFNETLELFHRHETINSLVIVPNSDVKERLQASNLNEENQHDLRTKVSGKLCLKVTSVRRIISYSLTVQL
jgi:hypothetical protein